MSLWERARRYAEKPECRVVGLMSGTSVDGVDAALVRIAGTGRTTQVVLEAFVTHPFPSVLRQSVLDLSHGEGNAEAVSRASFLLGGLFADSVAALMRVAGVAPSSLDLIASHGQTISHTAPFATLQIGEASLLALRFGVPVVSDFRTADLAAGGQGAPLVPYADWCLLTHLTKARAVQNIGGIGNVTYLPADAAPETVLGFDTGPGNMLIDRATQWVTAGKQTFDNEGELARSGNINGPLLDFLMRHSFLKVLPPKSAGREEFGEPYWTDISRILKRLNCPAADVAATLTAFTAESIVAAYRRFLPAMPDEVIIGGGGARNPTLMRMLVEKLTPIPVRTHEDMGINGDAKEALSFALLAHETMLGNASNLPSVTGAARPRVLGKLTLP